MTRGVLEGPAHPMCLRISLRALSEPFYQRSCNEKSKGTSTVATTA
jgi:hypothetical protein